ncbi:MAG: pyridoxal phosphate-dependent aminotransferase [Candidatus Atribacteria bacterium]|nr:pyridoxal phosphate-dependent aminotransferase [Candidatus Atribacteria bacterium]
MVYVADDVAKLPRSGIRDLMGMALAFPDAVHLEIGEPHFPTSNFVLERLKDFYSKGDIKYTPTVGIYSLRDKIAKKLLKEKNWKIDADDVIILPGSLFGTVVAFRTILEPGDEALIPDPGFTNHFSQVVLSGGQIKRYFLLPENNYLPDFESIRKSITPKTKIILVNTPSNPMGVVFPEEVMKSMADLAEEYNLVVISDEAYEKYIYQGEHFGMYRYVQPERLISIFSFSKTYALTGWRIGYMVVPKDLLINLTKVSEYMIACASHLSQKAAEIALDMPEEEIQMMVESYHQNCELCCSELEKAGFKVYRPGGGYYVWVDIREFGMKSLDFCKQLLKKSHVAVAPGDTFGQSADGFIRISICRKREEIEEGVKRIIAFRSDL